MSRAAVKTEQARFVHDTAIVEAGARLGDGASVWHHAHVRSGATIGSGTSLGKNVFVDAGAVVGSQVKIQNNVSVYAGVVIEDGAFVGPSVVFTNDLLPRSSGEWELVATRVCRGSSLGANSTIIAGIEIGEYAMVGAGAVVTKDVAAHELVLGNPARRAGWVCRCGQVITRVPVPPMEFKCEACRTRRGVGE